MALVIGQRLRHERGLCGHAERVMKGAGTLVSQATINEGVKDFEAVRSQYLSVGPATGAADDSVISLTPQGD